jgi:rubrerythrin
MLAVGAFLLIVMNRRKTRRPSAQSSRNLNDDDDSIGSLDPVQAAPMASNQHAEETMNRYCRQCGTALEAGTRFCPSCGTPASEPLGQIAPAARVGWTQHHLDPKVIQRARKNKKNAWIFTLVLTVLFPVGFALAGLFVEDMPMNEALIIGIGLGLLALVIGLVRVSRMKSGTWDGVVTDKRQKQKVEHDRDTTATRYRTVYTLSVREDSGKTHTLTYVDNRTLYDYFKVGDRIRCHQAFGTYEKYDKSADQVIYCNICGTLNDIAVDTCTSCRLPLFK